MNAPAFTPGPWSVLPVDQVPYGYWSVANCGGPHAENATGKSVLVIAPIKDYCKAAEDDARLIAAAPELYEALIACSRELHLICNRKLTAGEESALAIAHAALSKAQGGAA